MEQLRLTRKDDTNGVSLKNSDERCGMLKPNVQSDQAPRPPETAEQLDDQLCCQSQLDHCQFCEDDEVVWPLAGTW